MMSVAEVVVQGLCKSFGEVRVLDNVDLEVASGSIVCVMGASGGGKSTLLRCLNLLEIPTSGAITIAGIETSGAGVQLNSAGRVALRKEVGMIFQGFHLFPHLTATENVMVAQRVALHVSAEKALDRAVELLERVHLTHRMLAFPRQMSGGEQQRIAIARALALHPRVLLCDEPTSALDPESTQDVLAVLRELAQAGMTMIIATHETGFAREVADELVYIDDGQIVERGEPRQVIDDPQHERTRKFFKGVAARA